MATIEGAQALMDAAKIVVVEGCGEVYSGPVGSSPPHDFADPHQAFTRLGVHTPAGVAIEFGESKDDATVTFLLPEHASLVAPGDERAIVIDLADQDRALRLIVPRALVVETRDDLYELLGADADAVGVAALPAADGESWFFVSDASETTKP